MPALPEAWPAEAPEGGGGLRIIVTPIEEGPPLPPGLPSWRQGEVRAAAPAGAPSGVTSPMGQDWWRLPGNFDFAALFRAWPWWAWAGLFLLLLVILSRR